MPLRFLQKMPALLYTLVYLPDERFFSFRAKFNY